jgi:hypothetical protein
MALKITTQIGTDKGITSEAYVRISTYQVSKFGSANFQVEIFQSEEDVVSVSNGTPIMMVRQARNQQIGETLYVSLTKEVTETVTKTRTVTVPVVTQNEETTVNEEGETVTYTVDVTTYESQEEEYEETFTKIVPDLSSAEGVDIFAFGYSHLKTKLQDLFGEENVVDC